MRRDQPIVATSRWAAAMGGALALLWLTTAPVLAAEDTQPRHDGAADREYHQGHDGMHHAHPTREAEEGPDIPPITDADRAAAFPAVSGHPVHGNAIHYYALFDQLEWQDAPGGTFSWDADGWLGSDMNRLLLRSEGERTDGHTEEAEVQALYGRPIARWWEAVGGIRQDFAPGSAQTWAAVGVQGLAPYWFEVEATAFFGEAGQTAARFEAEYELLLTNRLILQPRLELNMHGQNDRRRGIGSGFSDIEAGLRLRYEFRREIAPYIGITWSRKLGRTADFAELEQEDVEDSRFVAGIRIWF